MNVDSDSKAVEDKLISSLEVTNEFNGTWLEISDCRNIRKIFFDFEIETCLEFNWYLYILLVVSSVALLVLFFLTWFLCLGLRYNGDENMKLPPKPQETVADELNFKDREKIPFY